MSVVVLSRCHEEDATRRQREDDLAFLAAGAGHDVLSVPHLYHLAPDAAVWRNLATLAAGDAAVTVLSWMHPRPAEALLRLHGAWGPQHRAINLDGGEAPTLWEQVAGGSGSLDRVEETTATRWYPLIDTTRCVQCQHCLQFCIFGVYALDADGALRVAKPDNCKAGCPACSRICPHSAIMFPLYGKDPAISGAPGLTVQPDAATRRMWYQRTGDTCPQCHQSGKGHGAASGQPCPVCGRAVAAAAADDLDGLIADLDRLDRTRHG